MLKFQDDIAKAPSIIPHSAYPKRKTERRFTLIELLVNTTCI